MQQRTKVKPDNEPKDPLTSCQRARGAATKEWRRRLSLSPHLFYRVTADYAIGYSVDFWGCSKWKSSQQGVEGGGGLLVVLVHSSVVTHKCRRIREHVKHWLTPPAPRGDAPCPCSAHMQRNSHVLRPQRPRLLCALTRQPLNPFGSVTVYRGKGREGATAIAAKSGNSYKWLSWIVISCCWSRVDTLSSFCLQRYSN